MKVICKVNRGYSLTIGKEYEAVNFEPQLICQNFTFPRYVTVIDDDGEESTGHAYRFKTLDGQCCDDYIKENYRDRKGY